MKRLLLLLAALFVISGSAWALPVDPMEAKSLAQTFYRLKFPKQAMPVFEDISQDIGVENFYIFHNVNGTGFVMVSGDDCSVPILGYSGTNNCRNGEIPDNVLSWLGYYDGVIGMAVQNGEEATQEIAEQWNSLRAGSLPEPKSTTAVSPLISTTWDQNAPYNNFCPGTDTNKAIVGCVATAMAQFMKYYNWPATGTGSYSYYCYYGEYNYGTLSANFGATNYDWNNMLNSYPYANAGTAVQQNAVATLMYHCGVSVQMMYAPHLSGAYLTDSEIASYDPNYPTTEKALKNYFNYSPSLVGRAKDDYTHAQWVVMLKSELDNAHPVLYAGKDQDGQGGHCFLCDGYDNANNFHFNWGWSGWYDGYFSLAALTPGPGGAGAGNSNYSYYQNAIFGAVPNNGGVNTDCDYLHFPLPGTPILYVLQSGGFLSGTNHYGDLAKADYFTHSGSGSIEKMKVNFGSIEGNSGSVAFTVWADNNGVPGNVLGSKTIALSTVSSTANNNNGNYECVFDSPITVNGNFFAGLDISNVTGQLGIMTTTDGDAANTGWEQLSDGQWVPYNSSNSWQKSLTHAIYPYVCPITTPYPPVNNVDLNMFADFMYMPNPMRQNATVYVSADIINIGNTAFTGSLRLALETFNDEFVQTIQQIPVSTPITTNNHTAFNFSGTVTATPGFYNLILYCKPDGTSNWIPVGSNYNASYQNPKSVVVTIPDGIDDYSIETVGIRPNPATDKFHFDIPDQIIDKVEIYSSTGELVHEQKNITSAESIDISFLRSGIYFVRYETSKLVGTLKLVVQ